MSMASARRIFAGGFVSAQKTDVPDLNKLVADLARTEMETRNALNHYGFQTDLLIQSLSAAKVTGEFHRVVSSLPGPSGTLTEHIISFPRPSLTNLAVTNDDLHDLSATRQFFLEPSTVDPYKVNYERKENVDGVEAFVLSVKPRGDWKKERPFRGDVWVSVKDHVVLKMRGKWEPAGNQRVPTLVFERTTIDGHSFPSRTHADEYLDFRTASVRIKIEARYTDYVKSL